MREKKIRMVSVILSSLLFSLSFLDCDVFLNIFFLYFQCFFLHVFSLSSSSFCSFPFFLFSFPFSSSCL